MHNIFLPVIAMVFLTFLTSVVMFRRRVSAIKSKQVSIRDFIERKDAQKIPTNTAAADHFMNQFETPVLFYLLCILLFVLEMVNLGWIVAAWLYVVTRIAHCWIHLTYNHVLHRFYAFVSSWLVLVIMWMYFAGSLFVTLDL